MKAFYVILILCVSGLLEAQDVGKIVIRNTQMSNPKFIVSLNGIRQNNVYVPEISFDFLDEYNYRVRILQMGVNGVLTFNVNNTPNYVTVYALNRDAYGKYALILESKSLLANEPPPLPPNPITLPPQPPVTPLPVNPRENACNTRLNSQEFTEMYETIRKESFESTKMDLAKNFFNPCELSSSQVFQVTKLFSMESNRLEFAKYAYSHTYDKKNFYKVYDAFMFSSSKKELAEYTKKHP